MTHQFVTVESYQFLPVAEATRMALQAEGIEVMLVDKETVSTDWALGNAIGYIKLQVPQHQVDAALGILEKIREARNARLAESKPDIDECLACGAPLQPEQSTCAQCGWSFAEEQSDSNPELRDHDSDSVEGAEKDSTDPTPVSDSLIGIKDLVIKLMLILPIAGIVCALILLIMNLLSRR
jgi:hypothetical protein